MDWIKKNYDKLLLGAFGLFALGIGGWLSLGAFNASNEEATTAGKITERSELGPDKIEETTKALASLLAPPATGGIWKSVAMGEHRFARLFTASPTLEKGAGNVITLLDDSAQVVREGVPNWWLYENNLDITRDDILTLDDDGDKFTNFDEFIGKSNPHDTDSRPAFYIKLRLTEIIEDKYEVRFSGAIGPDLQIKRLSPTLADGRQPGKLNYKIGDVLFDDDKRFKISKVEEREIDVAGQKQKVNCVILEDMLNPNNPLVIAERQTGNRPTYRAKIVSTISGQSETKKSGEEMVFNDFLGIKILLKKILPPGTTPGSVELEYSEPGQPTGKASLELTKEKNPTP
jgi:hypothetical protein